MADIKVGYSMESTPMLCLTFTDNNGGVTWYTLSPEAGLELAQRIIDAAHIFIPERPEPADA